MVNGKERKLPEPVLDGNWKQGLTASMPGGKLQLFTVGPDTRESRYGNTKACTLYIGSMVRVEVLGCFQSLQMEAGTDSQLAWGQAAAIQCAA